MEWRKFEKCSYHSWVVHGTFYIYSPKCLFGKRGSQRHNDHFKKQKLFVITNGFFFLPQSDTQRKIERLNDLKIKINNENTSTTYSTQNIRTQIIK